VKTVNNQWPPTNRRSWALLEVTMGSSSATQRKGRMNKKKRKEKLIIWIGCIQELQKPLHSCQKLITGSNQIPNYWLKAFPATHSCITKINIIIEQPQQLPDWLTTGITYLFPKSQDTKEPKYYWLITYLSTIHKALTGITARISSHFEEHILLPAEQRGCHSGRKGCKDQLLILQRIGGLHP
jgi:hypothetical protein